MGDNMPGVIGVYRSMSDAETAIRTLIETGFPSDKVSLIGQDLTTETQVHGFVTTGDVAKGGAKAGAWVGGIFGVLAGAALLVVPGVGPVLVLGPLAAGKTEEALTGLATSCGDILAAHFPPGEPVDAAKQRFHIV